MKKKREKLKGREKGGKVKGREMWKHRKAKKTGRVRKARKSQKSQSHGETVKVDRQEIVNFSRRRNSNSNNFSSAFTHIPPASS